MTSLIPSQYCTRSICACGAEQVNFRPRKWPGFSGNHAKGTGRLQEILWQKRWNGIQFWRLETLCGSLQWTLNCPALWGSWVQGSLVPLWSKRKWTLWSSNCPCRAPIRPVFHVWPFYGREDPSPITVDEETKFEVEAILTCWKRVRQVQYLIKCKGYSPEESSC